MPNLINVNVNRKLWLIIGSSLAGIIVLISMSLVFLKDGLIREREHMTRHLVETAHSVINSYYKMALDGKMSQEEARASAAAAVNAMRYDDRDMEYFWINDMQPKVVMHPIKPELNGKDVSDFKDPSGKRLFVEFVHMVKAKKAGFVYYLWPKPGFDKPVLKVSYVKGFEPWGWIVGSGIYLDDINAIFWNSARQYALAGMIILIVILAMSWIVAKNITRTEEALRISEEKFFKAFNASPDGVIISHKVNGLFIDANEAFFRMTGYARDEVIGHSSLDLGIWVDPGERSRIIERIERGGEARNIEILLRSKSNDIRTVLWTSDIIFLNGNECLITLMRDITELKEKEQQLLKSKAELTIKHEQLVELFRKVELGKMEWEQTMDCIDDMVLLVDKQEVVQRCNRAFVDFTGIPFNQVISANWWQSISSTGVEVMNFEGPSVELFHPATGRWFSLCIYPYSAGELVNAMAVVTLHDLTEIKLVSNELSKAYDDLKKTHLHLLQQEKMASIGQLAAGVAHEINNPIGFISSNLQTLGKYTDRLRNFIDTQSEALQAVAPPDVTTTVADLRKKLKVDYLLEDIPKLIAESGDGANRVKTIVQNLKSFSRVDEAKLSAVDLNECLESTISIAWNELKYKAALKREFGELPLVTCYPHQLNQVFLNLLVNGAHAIVNQGEITIKTWQEGDFVCVAVSDTGDGIPEEIRNRIFEPFFTTKEVGKGTGLGLSICYEIVQKHNGSIDVTSEVGIGTTFTVRLPVDGE